MKFGALTPAVKLPLEEKLKRMKDLGMDGWQPAHSELAQVEDLAVVKALAEEYGIAVGAVAAGVPMADPSKREENLAAWDQRVELAKAVGAAALFSRSFAKPDGVSDEEAWTCCVETARELIRRCEDNGLAFCFECDSGNFVDSLGAVLRLIDAVGSDGFGINFDPCNYYVGGGDKPMDVIDALYDRFVDGHIKDGVRPEGGKPHETPVGEGEVDYEQVLGELRRRGFDGCMVIEHCKSFDEIEAAWRHIQSVRAKLGM